MDAIYAGRTALGAGIRHGGLPLRVDGAGAYTAPEALEAAGVTPAQLAALATHKGRWPGDAPVRRALKRITFDPHQPPSIGDLLKEAAEEKARRQAGQKGIER